MNGSSNHAPRLLVSVRNMEEAEQALSGGADWIDLKDPSAGPLGAVDSMEVAAVANRFGSRSPMSAAGGELLDWNRSQVRTKIIGAPLVAIKLGLSGCRDLSNWEPQWQRAQSELMTAGIQLVAVAYADHAEAAAPAPEQVAALAVASHAKYFLVDTWDKSGRDVTEVLSPCELERLLEIARSGDMQTVVAGKLSIGVLPRLPLELIDVVAVRGAACLGGRTGPIAQSCVRDIRRALCDANAHPPKVVRDSLAD